MELVLIVGVVEGEQFRLFGFLILGYERLLVLNSHRQTQIAENELDDVRVVHCDPSQLGDPQFQVPVVLQVERDGEVVVMVLDELLVPEIVVELLPKKLFELLLLLLLLSGQFSLLVLVDLVVGVV